MPRRVTLLYKVPVKQVLVTMFVELMPKIILTLFSVDHAENVHTNCHRPMLYLAGASYSWKCKCYYVDKKHNLTIHKNVKRVEVVVSRLTDNTRCLGIF